jgi:hypothetical protein
MIEDVWVKLRWLTPIRHKRGALVVWLWPTPPVKPQCICYKLEEAIEMPCSDFSDIHHRKCIHGKMEIF